MNEAIVGIARAARFEQRTAAPLPGSRRAGRDLMPHFETSREAARAALREAPLLAGAHPLERLRRLRGVARHETHSPYQAAGVRSSLRTVRTASPGTVRHIARLHVGIFLVVGVQGQVGRRVQEQQGRLPVIGDLSSGSRALRVPGHRPIELLEAVPFDPVTTLKSLAAMATD